MFGLELLSFGLGLVGGCVLTVVVPWAYKKLVGKLSGA